MILTSTVELRVLIRSDRSPDEVEGLVRSVLGVVVDADDLYVEQVRPRHEVRPWIR